LPPEHTAHGRRFLLEALVSLAPDLRAIHPAATFTMGLRHRY